MYKKSKRDNPDLWELCKKEAVEKLGGKFSARAMQHAVSLYKKRGGGYLEPKDSDNSLANWSKKQNLDSLYGHQQER